MSCPINHSNPVLDALTSAEIDPLVYHAYKERFYRCTLRQLEERRDVALDAWEKRQMSVTITSATFEGGATSGQIEGNPQNVLQIFMAMIAIKKGQVSEAELLGASGGGMGRVMDMSHRRVET